MQRLQAYRQEEIQSLEAHRCRLEP